MAKNTSKLVLYSVYAFHRKFYVWFELCTTMRIPLLVICPFKEGDMIDVVEFIGEDWGRGRHDNKEGLFPLSFVAELEEVPPSPGETLFVSFLFPEEMAGLELIP